MKGGNAVNESLLIPDHAEERDHIRHKCRSDTRSGDKDAGQMRAQLPERG
jgi:hypothetical protein